MKFIKLILALILLNSMLFAQESNTDSLNTSLFDVPYPELHPLQLSSNWWDNFNIEDQTRLKENGDKIISNLKPIKEIFSKESIGENISTSIDNIGYSVSSYLSLKEKSIPNSAEINIIEDSYTIEDLLRLSEQSFSIKKKIDVDAQELKLKRSSLIALSQKVDNMTVLYLNIKEPSREKLIMGLGLIENQFERGITNREIELLDAHQKIKHKLLKRLEKELSSAPKLLKTDGESLILLEDAIEDKNNLILDIDKDISKLESELINLPIKADLQRSQKILLKEKIIKRSVDNVIAENELISLKLRKNILLLQDKENIEDIISFQNDLKIWQDLLEEVQDNIHKFQGRALQQQIYAIELYSRLISGNNNKYKIKRLNEEHIKKINEILSQISILEVEHYKATVLHHVYEEILNEYTSWDEKLTSGLKSAYVNTFKVVHDLSYFSLFKISARPITLAVIFKVILTLMFANFISKYIIKIVYRLAKKRRGISEANIFIFKVIIHYFILFIGILVALNIIGLTSGNLAIILGALSVGIGFGLQAIVNNFICGLIILFERNLKVGDYIKLESGDWGKIISVNMQNTIIQTIDGTDIIVPNSDMIIHKTTNWTMFNRYKRLHIPFTTDYGVDKSIVHKAAIEAALKVPATVSSSPLYEDPTIWMTAFGSNGIEFDLIVWINVYGTGSHGSLKSSYVWELDDAFKKYKIHIPYPQHDLNIKTDNTRNKKKYFRKGFRE